MSKSSIFLIVVFLLGTGFMIYVCTTQAYLQGKIDAYKEQDLMEQDYAKFQRRTGVCRDDWIAIYLARKRAECPGI